MRAKLWEQDWASRIGASTLAHIASDTSRRGVLERERVLLATRLRLLEREGIDRVRAFTLVRGSEPSTLPEAFSSSISVA